ncbi:MAG: aminotransferase class I/II-fold pyridoxal phosphate-dependent enzyme [Nitrospinaceae bacterium]|jgi:cystathionine gamma-synthase|nr:aminotransferase class I/II-fold pyridoxal phosphate-dependent enzyme [Nitrospinaceae bacterium]MBT4095568.1 aminotransferase class I/II-fold pyridoxal phosphate-dependent enzyme [Nitrospinaceae bacterium]MBT4431162.1 aminotransferase class I/II-fold pyridoxal phosphate-dependent enzyme [Nitrospinaceae bacterium]MBT5367760.1 aminotransferase class I/II-fold pyridoxal phosphate-dependent enzyme [Nitrospinaceae bacterium]MBT5947739.1 aminotransferase class I/II-fold pyridoxal phosphate-depende
MIDTPKDQQKTTSPAAKGGSINPHAESSLPPPIFQTATFTFGSAAELAAFHGGENDGYFYSRYGNPTVAAAARRLSRLEGAEASILYASGMAAVSSAFLALLGSGARLVLLGETYRHTKDFAESVLARYGVIVEILEDNSPEALDSIPEGPVRVLFSEVPSNPTMRVPDIVRLAEWSKSRGAKLIVDATIASPALLRPLEHGADLVVHSATKFLGGHNDLLAGAISGSQPFIDALAEQQALLGDVLSPQTAFLLDRGMKTLNIRVERQSETALRLAEFLSGLKQVKKVHYPGLESHPDHETAKKMMTAFGGMLSFELNGGPEAADQLVDALKVPVLAAGFGGTESQAEHHARMAYADLGLIGAQERGVTPGLIRYSVGLEDFDALRDDLTDGLKKI